MPSTIADVFAAAGTSSAGVVRWGTPPTPPTPRTASATGVYVVALTDEVDSLAGTLAAPPISGAAVDELLGVRPELTLDDAYPTREQLVQRLAAFWLPDEVVVYIGLAGPRKNRPAQGEVAKRVGEYYDTPLGARRPHAGGWPLKTLACLRDLYMHFAYCDRVNKAEVDCIGHFAKHVSETTRAGLRDPVRVMPFANLEFPKGNSKNHGIRGARAPKGDARREAAPDRPGAPSTWAAFEPSGRREGALGGHPRGHGGRRRAVAAGRCARRHGGGRRVRGPGLSSSRGGCRASSPARRGPRPGSCTRR